MPSYLLSPLPWCIITVLTFLPHLSTAEYIPKETWRNETNHNINGYDINRSALPTRNDIVDSPIGPKRRRLHHGRFGSAGVPGFATGFDEEGGSVFRAFWNVPDLCGERHGIDIPLADFGIEFNSNHDWHHGDVINFFDRSQIGLFPFLNENNRFVHGGLPQLANITAHLEKATADIIATMPDPGVGGIGMLDWEVWSPQWQLTQDRYRDFSMGHVRQLHPEWDRDTVTRVAALEWTQAARLFMESTLQLVKRMRPNAVWGFYHYPYCVTRITGTSCKPSQPEHNDQLMWLFNESTVIYPSIYLVRGEDSAASVDARLAEAFRVREKSSDPKGVVLSYTRFNYTKTNYYYTLEDLNKTILKSAEFGTHGVVFWGNNVDDRYADTCHELRAYVENALGPAVVLAREGALSCSRRVCSGHGRCVGEILACGKSLTDTKRKQYPGTRMKDTKASHSCTCRCFRGWSGVDCSKVA